MPTEDIEDFKATPVKLKEGRSIINDPNIPSGHKYPTSDKRMDTLRMMYKVGFGHPPLTMGPRFAAERFLTKPLERHPTSAHCMGLLLRPVAATSRILQ